MTRDEILDFAIGEGKIKFDSQINQKFDFKKDFDGNKLNKYLKLANISKNLNIKDILINIGLAKKEKGGIIFNNAGILFFAKKSEKFFFSSKVICVDYQTNEKVNILDRKIFDDGIINNIEEAINYVKKHIDVKFIIKTLKRKEIPQYPEEAYREVIVNAIMHRDYFDDSGDILVEIFRNKIIISNPGGLVKSIDPKEFGKVSRTRNSLIANLLSKTKYVEKVGTGIKRIRDAMNRAKLPSPEFEFPSSFFVTLYDKTFLEKTAENASKKVEVNGGVNGGVNLLFNHIKNNHGKRVIHFKEELNLTRRTVERWLNKLKKDDNIEFKGSSKTGGYYCLNNTIKNEKKISRFH